jgi:hypothetical protein
VALISFDSATPGSVSPAAALTGIVAGQSVRAIDFRPRSGALYAVSHDDVSDAAQVYTVNPVTGVASAVGAGFVFVTGSTNLSMDFNPVADRIRLVAGDGASARVNPDTGSLAGSDTMLAYAPGDPNMGTPLVTGIAYTSNHAGASSTTLHAYDFNNDVLGTIGGPAGVPSPNGGQMFTTGATGVLAGSGLGMDIGDRSGIAYVSVAPSGTFVENLYRANLATGALTLLGNFGSTRILDIAVAHTTAFRNGFE